MGDSDPAARLREFLLGKRTLVCVGSGGVGKTTVSAALALHAAVLGRRALVLTVDPARRLASALGIGAFSEEQRRIDGALLTRAGLRFDGTLDAAMLDTKSTFDRIVARYAPNEEVRDRILRNPFYRQASTALAGSQEYMAMEKLYEIREDGRDVHDLIVLDTPPSNHALDFLSAPARMQHLMDSATFRLFVRSVGAASGGGFGRLNRFVLSGVGRFLGTDVFLSILEFLESFSSMYDGFSQRSARVEQLLRQEDVAFLVVTSADGQAVDEALFLRETLVERGMPFGAFVVNRVQPAPVPDGDVDKATAALEAAMVAEPALGLYSEEIVRRVARRVARHTRELETLAERDARTIDALRAAAGSERVFELPRFPEDIHDLTGLSRFASVLVQGERAGAASDHCGRRSPE